MLSPSGRSDELVALFKDPLAAHGYLLPTGTLVDSSVVQVPRQRNSREENTTLKSGEVPSDWKEQPHKLCPKDTEARWLKKKGVSHFGDKNHIAVDRAIKLITNWEVSRHMSTTVKCLRFCWMLILPRVMRCMRTVRIVRRKDFLVCGRRGSHPGSRTRPSVASLCVLVSGR